MNKKRNINNKELEIFSEKKKASGKKYTTDLTMLFEARFFL